VAKIWAQPDDRDSLPLQSDSVSVTSNPYAPPAEADPPVGSSFNASVTWRRGPAWYIVFAGLLGGFASIPFLSQQNAMAFATIPIGCVFGGLVFRVRSQSWPHDATVRSRQIIFSMLAAFLPPLCLFVLGRPYGQGPAIPMIGAIVGTSIACGIFVSGTRRFDESQVGDIRAVQRGVHPNQNC